MTCKLCLVAGQTQRWLGIGVRLPHTLVPRSSSKTPPPPPSPRTLSKLALGMLPASDDLISWYIYTRCTERRTRASFHMQWNLLPSVQVNNFLTHGLLSLMFKFCCFFFKLCGSSQLPGSQSGLDKPVCSPTHLPQIGSCEIALHPELWLQDASPMSH